MTGADRHPARAIALTGLLLALIGLIVWAGLRTGHLEAAPAAAPSATPRETPPTTPTAVPTTDPAVPAGPALVPSDPAVAAAFADRAAELGGRYALAWVDSDGLHVLGSVPEETAWSTMKVPLSIAAAARQPTDQTWQLIEAAITRSDNDAAAVLWASLGPPEEAARAVDEVLDAYGSSGTRTEPADVRPGFSSFGQTRWDLASQARFASALACVPEPSAAGRVRAAMGRVIPDQRWGIGTLDEAHLKGGWGPDAAGAYVLRQLGDGQVDGKRYALALTAASATGGHAHAAADATALVRWWVQAVEPAGGLDCSRG